MIITIGKKDYFLGKWSPNWEGPLLVNKILLGNAYQLSDLSDRPQELGINGKYLKK